MLLTTSLSTSTVRTYCSIWSPASPLRVPGQRLGSRPSPKESLTCSPIEASCLRPRATFASLTRMALAVIGGDDHRRGPPSRANLPSYRSPTPQDQKAKASWVSLSPLLNTHLPERRLECKRKMLFFDPLNRLRLQSWAIRAAARPVRASAPPARAARLELAKTKVPRLRLGHGRLSPRWNSLTRRCTRGCDTT